jgi:hypothetical protein
VIKFTTVIVAHVCKYPISLANGAYIINDVRLLSNPLVNGFIFWVYGFNG